MKLLIAGFFAVATFAGVSRFAGSYGPYYGPGSPPRDSGEPGPNAG